MSEFVLRKNALLFYKMDVDGDGLVKRSDFLEAGKKVAAALGRPDGGKTEDAFDRMWSAYWGIADGNGDGAISLMEWLGAQQAAYSADPQGWRGNHEATISLVVDCLDDSGDGVVTQREFRAYCAGLDVHPDVADAAFAKMDLDGDGRLSREQMIDLLWDYHTSGDMAAVGNWAYGGV